MNTAAALYRLPRRSKKPQAGCGLRQTPTPSGVFCIMGEWGIF